KESGKQHDGCQGEKSYGRLSESARRAHDRSSHLPARTRHFNALRRNGKGFDGSDKPVTASGDGFNVLQPAVQIRESFAQDEDVLIEVALLNGGIGPYPAHQFVLIHKVTGVLEEVVEGVGYLWCKGNRPIIAN